MKNQVYSNVCWEKKVVFVCFEVSLMGCWSNNKCFVTSQKKKKKKKKQKTNVLLITRSDFPADSVMAFVTVKIDFFY